METDFVYYIPVYQTKDGFSMGHAETVNTRFDDELQVMIVKGYLSAKAGLYLGELVSMLKVSYEDGAFRTKELDVELFK